MKTRRLPVDVEEWKTKFVENAHLNAADEELAAQLSVGESGRLYVDQLASGVRIRTTSWVGIVRFSELEIHVIPKVAGSNLGLVRLIDYVGDLSALRRHSHDVKLDVAGENLFDLVALLLSEACSWVVRRGVLSDYIGRQDEVPAARGRILIARQMISERRRPGRISCEYDEREPDILDNRLLSTALAVCRRWVASEHLKVHLSRLLMTYADISPPGEPKAVAAEEIVYDRLNEHYREAHALARLALQGLAFEDLFARGTSSCFAFLLDMNPLFEKFVWKFITKILCDRPYGVDYQRRDRSVIFDATAQRPYARVVPDLLVQHQEVRGLRLPIDAKYKLYGEGRVSNEDVYQSFLYAFAFTQNTLEHPRRAMIVYPATNSIGTLDLEIRGPQTLGAQISIIGCPIPEALSEVTSGVPGPATSIFCEAIDRAMASPHSMAYSR